MNTVDAGASILLDAQVQGDFTAETTLAGVAAILRLHGLPEQTAVACVLLIIYDIEAASIPCPASQS